MKGYIVKNGKIFMMEKNKRAVGAISLPNGIKAWIDIPANMAKLIRLNNASEIIDGCKLAMLYCHAVSVGPFIIGYDNYELVMTNRLINNATYK